MIIYLRAKRDVIGNPTYKRQVMAISNFGKLQRLIYRPIMRRSQVMQKMGYQGNYVCNPSGLGTASANNQIKYWQG